MSAVLWWALWAVAPAAAQPAPAGGLGLLNVPSAAVAVKGTAYFQFSRIHPDLELERDRQTDAWYGGIGLLPGLELGGRAIGTALRAGRRDLSLDARYQLPVALGRWRFALGAMDLGGVERLLPREYGTASWYGGPLTLTVGYGRGRNVLDGVFGGAEWRPWPSVGLLAEHDSEDANAGIKLRLPINSPWHVGFTAAYRGALDAEEYAVNVEFPLGRRWEYPASSRGAPPVPSRGAPLVSSRGAEGDEGSLAVPPPLPPSEKQPVPRSARDDTSRDTLHSLGFESIRTGRRGDVLVVRLENRRYNHSQADGLGLALGVIAQAVAEDVRGIELYLYTYGVPQLRLTVPAALYREFLADPAAADPGLRAALQIAPAARIADEAAVVWDQAEADSLQALELVLEPLLRTYVATEYGLLDYAAGARARLTAPIARGLMVQLGAQAPLAESDDLGNDGPFAYTAPEGGMDLALAQYLHTPAAGWTLLWSAGRSQVYRVDADTLALDQAWSPGDGRHRWRLKLMTMQSDNGANDIALAGYDWQDARRAYSIGLTAGRFYAGDFGGRLDLERRFGDTFVGLFYKGASSDDQAVGIGISLPLTPRRDAQPRSLQIKGPRRWMHGLASTLNAPPSATSPNGTNPIRPLMLYEPVLDLDLERDIQDAGRLNAEYLRQALPRMWEAYARWGR